MSFMPGLNDIRKAIPQPVKTAAEYGVNTTYNVIDGLDRVVAKSPGALLDFMCLTSYVAQTALKSARCNPELCTGLSDRALSNVDCLGSVAAFSGFKFFLSGDWRNKGWLDITRSACSTTSGVAMAALWALEQRLVDGSAFVARAAQYPLVGRVTVGMIRQGARGLSVVSVFIEIYQIGNPLKLRLKDTEKMLHLASCVSSVSLKLIVIAGVSSPAGILALSVVSTGLSLGHFLYKDYNKPDEEPKVDVPPATGILGNRVVKVVSGAAQGTTDMLDSVGSLDKLTKAVGAVAGAVVFYQGPGAGVARAVSALMRSSGAWFKLGKATTAWKGWAGRVKHLNDPEGAKGPKAMSTWEKVQTAALTASASLDVAFFAQGLKLVSLGAYPLRAVHFGATAVGLGSMGVRVWSDGKLSTRDKAIKSLDCGAKVALSGLALAAMTQTHVFVLAAVFTGLAGVYLDRSKAYGWGKAAVATA